jgi:hypothetical protein
MTQDNLALGLFIFLWVFVLLGFIIANCEKK